MPAAMPPHLRILQRSRAHAGADTTHARTAPPLELAGAAAHSARRGAVCSRPRRRCLTPLDFVKSLVPYFHCSTPRRPPMPVTCLLCVHAFQHHTHTHTTQHQHANLPGPFFQSLAAGADSCTLTATLALFKPSLLPQTPFATRMLTQERRAPHCGPSAARAAAALGAPALQYVRRPLQAAFAPQRNLSFYS